MSLMLLFNIALWSVAYGLGCATGILVNKRNARRIALIDWSPPGVIATPVRTRVLSEPETIDGGNGSQWIAR